jgi:hypothetical protein
MVLKYRRTSQSLLKCIRQYLKGVFTAPMRKMNMMLSALPNGCKQWMGTVFWSDISVPRCQIQKKEQQNWKGGSWVFIKGTRKILEFVLPVIRMTT